MLEFCGCKKDGIMAYKCGSRDQITLFPQSIDEYIGEEHPVRAYDTFIEVLNPREIDLQIETKGTLSLSKNLRYTAICHAELVSASNKISVL
jgi:transposase